MENLQEDKGLTIVDIVKIVKEFWVTLKQRRLIVFFIVFLSGFTSLVVYFYSDGPQYIATTTLMLENNKSGGGGGALALASQLGLVGSGGGSGIALSEDKLLEIIKSEAIIKIALFDKVTIDSIEDSFANHFISLFGYTELWKKNDSLRNFKFENTKEKLTKKENAVFKTFYGQVIGDFLKVEQSPKSGIVKIIIQTPSQEFSKTFNQSLVNALTTFYVDRITEKERKSLIMIQKRVDSVAGALRDAEYAYARWKDGSNQLVKAQGLINEIRLRRDVEVANSMYIEGVKQLEIARFSLLQETPILQVIDAPSLPLSKTKKTSMTRYLLIGCVIGSLLAIMFIFLLKKYIEIKDIFVKTQF
ncbi:MAG: hypothetical protein WBM13_08375 [Bacteroidia bacterium]